MSLTLYTTETAEAKRLAEVGGYGMITKEAPSFEYGSLDSEVSGSVKDGEIVYIRAWQIGVYYIGDNRWVSDEVVQPIIDSRGRPMVDFVSKKGDTYFVNDAPLPLPEVPLSRADKFLANPDSNTKVTYNGTKVPSDWQGELVDTSAVWYSPPWKVKATMRVTDAYDFIWLFTKPDINSPVGDLVAYKDDILTAYEVKGDWYRVNEYLWAPATWGDEVLMVPETVENYAAPEYTKGGKWISIDLNRQHITAWEGKDVIANGPMKSGKYGWHTPAGTYKIFEKVPNERMSGPDYDLLDVGWAQYFTRSRIAIHAAYWHYNYNGRPGSHGCVNTPEDLAKMLFMWSPVGTTVVTHNPYVFDEQDIADANKWSDFSR
ncbi:MAG: L,D-transpeptidase [Ardenticatenaceae bacterium]